VRAKSKEVKKSEDVDVWPRTRFSFRKVERDRVGQGVGRAIGEGWDQRGRIDATAAGDLRPDVLIYCKYLAYSVYLSIIVYYVYTHLIIYGSATSTSSNSQQVQYNIAYQ
jgi:hypothetical protein